MNPNYRRVEREYDGDIQVEFQLAGKLKRIGTVVDDNKNTNGKQFIINEVEIPLTNGKMATRTALCYEGNYNHPDILEGKMDALKVGEEYLVTLRFDEKNEPQLQQSHLSSANRATAADFAELYEAEGIPYDKVTVTEATDTATSESSKRQAQEEGAPKSQEV